MFKTFLHDERGTILSIEMILTATLVVLGCIVGLTAFRDAMVQELGDVSAGMSGLNHSYTLTDVSLTTAIDNVRTTMNVSGSGYIDNLNDGEPAVSDPVALPPMCIDITAGMIIDEGMALP